MNKNKYRENQYFTNVISGNELIDSVSIAAKYEKRDLYEKIKKFLYSDPEPRICVIYGLKMTGKLTLICQLILNMNDEDILKTVYIKIKQTDTMSNLEYDLDKLYHLGYKYIFIDEITLMKNFIGSASILSDIYAPMGMKIILSGTDSLSFRLSENHELYDRAYNAHTTFIPFREYSRLLNNYDIDKHIKYGGILKTCKTTDFEQNCTYTEDISFRDVEAARRYVDIAVCKNIQQSLIYCEKGSQLRHLKPLYENDVLTTAISRIIENMNYSFLLDVITREFKTSEVRIQNSESIDKKHTKIFDSIDMKTVTKKLTDILDIKNQEEQAIGINKDNTYEINRYLKEIDLIYECEIITAESSVLPLEYTFFTQPGLRYCQVHALTLSLVKDKVFGVLEKYEQEIVINKIIKDIKERMLADIVLLETTKAVSKKRFKVFKLRFCSGDYDMVIYDKEENVCGIYEVKNSKLLYESQHRHLIDEDKCNLTERRFGKIVRKTILYRGEDHITDNCISYKNIENYLNNIKTDFRL